MSKHPIVHIELSANDPEAAGKFYSDAFDWKFEAIPEMNYVTFEAEGGPGGGFNPTSSESVNPGDVLVYIQTDDIEASLAKVESLGGKALMPKTEIPNTGWFGIFSDPTGNNVGLYTPLSE